MAILLVDGDNLAWRSHHAAAALADGKGNLTGCFFQAVISLHKLVSKMEPHGMIVFWDGAKSKRRMSIWPLYKANRHSSKPGLGAQDQDDTRKQVRRQMQDLRDIALPALGIPQVYDREWEADDLIWAATKILKAKMNIVSTDSDFLQLVDDQVYVWHPSMKKPERKDRQGRTKITLRGNERGVLITPDNFTQITGYDAPHIFLDAKVLVGDTTDNIPGIRGMGDSKAQAMLRQFGDLEGILTNIEMIREKGGVIWKRVVSSDGLKTIRRNYDMIGLHLADFHPDPINKAIKAKTDTDLLTIAKMFRERGSSRLAEKIHPFFKKFKDMEIRWSITRKRLLEGR